MTQLVGGVDRVQQHSSRNLREIAAYLRDMLEDRSADHSDAAVLAKALDSVERELARSYGSESRSRSAA
jgi:hypothetical protein